MADTIVLKEGSALTPGGALDAAFASVTTGDIVNVTINDTVFHDNHADNQNRGSAALFTTSMDDKLFKFDFSSISGFDGATINSAQLRVWQTNGNNSIGIARNLEHDWTEALAVRNDPQGSTTNRWGPASNAEFGPQ